MFRCPAPAAMVRLFTNLEERKRERSLLVQKRNDRPRDLRNTNPSPSFHVCEPMSIKKFVLNFESHHLPSLFICFCCVSGERPVLGVGWYGSLYWPCARVPPESGLQGKLFSPDQSVNRHTSPVNAVTYRISCVCCRLSWKRTWTSLTSLGKLLAICRYSFVPLVSAYFLENSGRNFVENNFWE